MTPTTEAGRQARRGEAAMTDPLAAHDLGCHCWPHVGQREAQEAVIAAATEEYRAGKRAATPPAIDPERLARALRYIHGDVVPLPNRPTVEEYAAKIVECDAIIEAER